MNLGHKNEATGSACNLKAKDMQLEMVTSAGRDDLRALLKASSIHYNTERSSSWMGPVVGQSTCN